jgi:subtilisin-like proprotein convertase family protein
LVATVTVTPLIPVGGNIPGGPVTFTNTANIAIPGSGTGSGTGSAANPYPSNITVSGVPTTGVTVQSVTLTNIQHTWSDDIGVLLVGPGGQNFVPMARVGGSGGFDATATVTLRDGNPAMPTGTAAIPSGTYAPTAGTTAIWPAPAPGTPYNYPAPQGTATFANTFNNTSNYNGTWSLYVTDMAGGDVGNIAGGWGITLVTPSIPAVGCAGTPRTFTITVNPNPAIIVIADPGTTICEGDPTLLTVVTGTATPLGVLYNQTGAQANGSPSQVFEPANTAFNSQSADDFLVPAGATWNITQMTANGIGAGAPTSVNVFFYANSGSNLPGTAIATFNNVTTFTQAGGNYTVTLPSTVSLPGGRYWVSFQVNMAFATGGQWFWGNFGAPVIGNEYAFQNPGGGFATPCTSWGYAGSGCNVGGGAANVNSIFSLTGTSVTSGGPLGAGYTFLWSPAAGLSSTTSNPVAASPQNTTTYTVTATTPGGCSRTATVLITVNKRPVVTTQPVNTVRCVGTTATYTVGATGTGLTYQWQLSTTGCAGPWTNLTNGGVYSGATAATLNVGPVTGAMNGYAYRCIVSGVCAPWTPPTNVSNCATLTVNPLPVVAITPPISCGGVAGINGTLLSVGSAPPPVPGSVTVNSGTINLAVPDNTANGVSNVIAMAGVPANATITNVTVTLNNFSHTYPGDIIMHLQAPNGNILNLYKYGTGVFTGAASGVPTWGWYGAKVSQLGTTAWSTVNAAPYIYNNSIQWKADAINTPVGGGPVIQNPTGFVSNATGFADLYTTPASTTGNWTLAMCDGGPGDVGTLASWGITIDYTTPGSGGGNNSYVWSPLAGLYNNSTATSPYTGTNTPSIYAAPTVFTAYTVTATDNVTGCVNTATAFVNYTPPAPTVTPSSVTMCLGDPAVRLVSSSSTSSTITASSGAISVVVPDGTGAPATSSLTVAGVPAGSILSEIKVTLNMSHTWVGDMDINLVAPNNQILNLVGGLDGGTGSNGTANFTNTAFSSLGGATISGAAAPRTGTYAAEARAGYGPTGFIQTVSNWNGLAANAAATNGTWRLAMGDYGGGDVGTLTSWSIGVTYVLGVPSTPATWSPIAGLFNDAAATIPYTGTPRDTVWTRPTPAGVYPYQATVQSLPVPPLAFANPAAITINDGTATPYPSNVVVSGLPTSGVTVKNVTINGLSHTWSDDVDILLQSPSGQNVILMSDIGNAGAFSGNNYTFDDAAAAMPATAAAPPSGTYKPTNFVGLIGVEPDNWPAPGPGSVAQPNPTLSSFTGNMNGTWKLFVFDDAAGDQGTIAGGFSVGFNLGIPPCTSPARTVIVTVNQPAALNNALPVSQTICTDKVATFTVAVATGTGPFTYQWQVSTNGNNPPWTNISNGGVYSGATTATLTITAPPVSMSGYFYRCIVTGAAPCGSATSFAASLTVNPLPTVVISAAPYTSLFPGLRTTLSSTVSPAAASTYTWLRNGVAVSGATTGTLNVDVDGLGDYQLRVTDVNGCTNSSNIVTIKDSASGRCFIYPNPNSGQFQVRYYSVANNVLPRGIVVYDAKGDRVLSQNYTIGRPYDRMDVDLRAKGKGLYWVEIVDRNGNRLTMCRVVIE